MVWRQIHTAAGQHPKTLLTTLQELFENQRKPKIVDCQGLSSTVT